MGSDGRITDPELQFTWEEIELEGVPLYKLRPGDRFVCVSNASPDGTLGMATYTGKLVYPGVGSALVQLDRSWEDRIRWAPECKVIPLPKPVQKSELGHMRVSLNPANFDNGGTW